MSLSSRASASVDWRLATPSGGTNSALGATFFPASLTAILRNGPFAYDGLIGFWVPYPAWLVWMFVASYYLLGDLKRRVEVGEGEEAPLPMASMPRPVASVARQTTG